MNDERFRQMLEEVSNREKLPNQEYKKTIEELQKEDEDRMKAVLASFIGIDEENERKESKSQSLCSGLEQYSTTQLKAELRKRKKGKIKI